MAYTELMAQDVVPGPHVVAHTQHHGTDSDEELALLPRGTRVRVIGNARTKQSLIGKNATVLRAQGLGGWHYLQVDDSGEEIKIQRNALLVLERPSGNVQDYSEDEQEEQQRRLLAEQRRQEQQQQRQRQYQRQQQMEALEYEDARPRQRRAPRPLIAEEFEYEDGSSGGYEGGVSGGPAERQPAVRPRHVPPSINLGKLDMAALKRYRTYYQLPEPAGPVTSKDDLVSMVAQHWAQQTVDEVEVISHFLKAARRHGMGSTQCRQ